MFKNLCFLPLIVLAACGGIPIENQIAATRASLTVAQNGARGYVEQPLCRSPEAVGKPICSKPSIIAKIKTADSAAMTAMSAAEEAKDESSLLIAQTSFNALLEITNIVLAGR